MAQEDRGLVLRGLVLFAGVGVLVTIVLTILFTRPQPVAPTADFAPENLLPLLLAPNVAGYPAGVAWGAVEMLGETMPSAPGWEIRYNAVTALARRGSSAVPWALMREMLDEKQQMRNARVRVDGKDVIDEAAARSNMIGALKALAAWHEAQKGSRETSAELREIYTAVEKLTESAIPELKAQAEKARGTFFKQPANQP